MLPKLIRGLRIPALLILSAAAAAANPTFNFTLGSGITVGDPAYNGFVAAAARWSNIFSDNVIINLDIDFSSLGGNILGETGSTFYSSSYAVMTTALALDALSADDLTAVAHLQLGTSEDFVQNHTAECSNCTSVYLDNNGNFNNTHVYVTGAEARALQLIPQNNASDGSISFSSDFSFDFDPSDGIDPGKYDFVGVATHEIGHLLGFVSTVDDYDYCGGDPANCTGGTVSEEDDAPTVLDLFRYSSDSGFGTRMDQSADARPKYFSIDGGVTQGPRFATGSYFGDGRQASHWRDGFGIGIMDPTVAPGELLAITSNDIQALDVSGWDLASTAAATPEPGALGLFCAGALLLGVIRYSRA